MATMRINCLHLIKRMRISKMQMPSFTEAAWARYFVPNQRTTVHESASWLFYAAISMQRSCCSIDGCEQILAIEWLPEETTIVPSESQLFVQLITAADKDY